MSDHVDRVLQRALAAWDDFVSGQADIDALRESVRAAHWALDGADVEWRDLLDDWSSDLDGMDARSTRYQSQEDVWGGAVQARFEDAAARVRRHLAASE